MSEAIQEETLQLNPEEIKQLSRILADTFVQQMPKMELTVFTCVSGYEIIKEDQITKVVNLDLIASATHGITDILGQISGWFRSILDSVSSWIVSSIQTFIQGIVATVSTVINTVTTAVSGFISNAVSTITGAITGAIYSISSTVSGFISNAISTLSSAITGVVSAIGTAISGAVSAITSAITGIVSTISSALSGVASALMNAITGAVSSISNAITGVISALSSAISGAISAISGAITGVISAISSALSGIASAIMGAISGVISAISGVISGLASAIMGAISGVISAISGVISGLASAIMGAISGVISALTGVFQGIASAIMGAITGVISAISGAINAVGTAIMNAITGFISMVTTAISAVTKTITDAFSTVGKTILDALSSFLKTASDMFGTIAKGIMDGITGLGKGIADLWNFLVGAFQDMVNMVSTGFEQISKTFMGFVNAILSVGGFIVSAIQTVVNAILQLPQTIMSGLKAIGDWIWNALPPFIREALIIIRDFFKGIADAVIAFVQDPWGTLQKIAEAIWAGLKWLGERIWEGLQFIGKLIWQGLETLWNIIKAGLEWLAKAIVNLGATVVNAIVGAVIGAFKFIAKTILDAVHGFVNWVVDSAKVVAEGLGNLITGVVKETLKPMLTAIASEFEEPFTKLVEKLAKGEKTRGEVTELLELGGLYTMAIVGSQYMSVGLWAALHALATPLDKATIRIPFKLRVKGKGKGAPGGVGAEAGADVEGGAEVPITINLGLTMRHIASEIRKYGDTLGRSLLYGIGIWLSQPFMRLANSAFRNVLMLEMPSVADMAEITRRYMPTDEFEETLESYRRYLRLYGYNDQVIEWLTSTELKFEVTDRFGTKRTIPISLMYQLPSASDVATMMVRDVFASFEEFQKLYQARGMHPDVGALYYFLRFRYPPPERLWQFTVRGISGLLWATLPDTERAEIEKEIKAIGAFMPVAPINMNFQADKLLNAFKTYMKWHDYFRGAWIKDFPSDNLIYIDTLAEVPTKIDQRWMVKWGVYELLSAKQVTYQSAVKEFATKILENAPASEIKMDLTNFSRTILATGLHPDWVPATAVAEAMNVLTEERTALRTGFMGLFKEGFMDIEALDTILAGFIKTSFQVAYFDIAQMKWTTGWVNMPVVYLPPERKLLELKALMDRSLDILREIQKDISIAYQEYIIRDYNVYKTKLTEVINQINEFYAKDYEAITGVKLPDELKLKFVEDYYKPYVEALRIWRDVFTVRRIRMWTQRWLGWVMYRVAYGVVTKEDVEKLITYVSDKAKLTDQETEFIKQVMEIMYGIARRSTVAEYLPTPSTLATLSEYMTLDTELVKQVLTERGLDEAWQKIWLTYIAVRPIKADAKALLSTYVRAFRYGVVDRKVLEDYLKELPNYGFTAKEIEFITKAVDIEEQILEYKENRREYIPTLSTLASMSEYIVISEQLIQQVFTARKVPAEWQAIWKQYISIRPIVDDVKGLLASYRRALVYVVLPDDIKKKVEAYATTIGFTQTEWDILALRATLEELVNEARTAKSEYIPTPMTLATICEYLPQAREFYDDVVKAKRIPKEWHELWAKYIDIRPLVDDIKRYVSRAESLYVHFMTKKEDFEKILKEVSSYLGYTSKEIEFLMKVTEFERYSNAWRELIGSVERLVSLSEYSPRASKYALGKLYEMIDALPLPPSERAELKAMWEEYIRNRPVKSEAKTYITQLINAYVEGIITDTTFKKELQDMKQWGFSDNELMFYEAQAALRKARKWKIPIGE